MKNFILGSIITFLLCGGVYLYLKNDALNYRVETLKTENLTKLQPDLQKAKEDFYIEQINRDSTLILFTVTALFAIFSATTFFGVKSEFNSNIKKIKNDFQSQTKELKNYINRLKNIESNICLEKAMNYNEDRLKPMLKKKKHTPEDITELTDSMFFCLKKYCESIMLYTDDNKYYKIAVIGAMEILIRDVIEIINKNNIKEIELDSSYDKILEVQKNIVELNSFELSKQVAFIYSMLIFKNLDDDDIN